MDEDRDGVARGSIGRCSNVGQIICRRGRGCGAGGVIGYSAAGVAVPCAGADLAGFGIDVGVDGGGAAGDVAVGRGEGVGGGGDAVAFAVLCGGAERLADLAVVEGLTVDGQRGRQGDGRDLAYFGTGVAAVAVLNGEGVLAPGHRQAKGNCKEKKNC